MLKRNPLTIGTLIFLCGYYLLALQNHALPFQGEEDSFDIFNARWLGGVGQVLNYWQNLTPQWIALGAKQPTHWYFHSRPDFYSPASLALTEIYSALENRDFIAAWRKQGLTVVILPIPAKS
ncbi:MAG: hypothetical protein HY074_11155, partial [Deltaproteobacteria bacterium]|nr:hypothetical protein [Deltaproteobacteria bacterium]